MLQTLETAEQCEWEEEENPSLCILEIPLAEERDKSSRPPGRAGCSGGGSLPPRMEGGQAVAQECAQGFAAGHQGFLHFLSRPPHPCWLVETVCLIR